MNSSLSMERRDRNACSSVVDPSSNREIVDNQSVGHEPTAPICPSILPPIPIHPSIWLSVPSQQRSSTAVSQNSAEQQQQQQQQHSKSDGDDDEDGMAALANFSGTQPNGVAAKQRPGIHHYIYSLLLPFAGNHFPPLPPHTFLGPLPHIPPPPNRRHCFTAPLLHTNIRRRPCTRQPDNTSDG